MNWKFKIIIAALALTVAACGNNNQEKVYTEPVQDEAEIKSLKNLSDAYVEAYNHRDAKKLASLWTQDGTFVSFTVRETIVGRDELFKYFTKQFKEIKDADLKVTIESRNLKEPGKAIEKGVIEITHKGKPIEKSVFQATCIKEDGAWLIQKVTEIEIQEAPTHVEYLKELEWLVGTWINEGDNVTVRSTFKWGKNKNFIVQHFTMNVLNQKEIEGHQIIGWDPAKKRIRSWTFDSDGGFGESFWSRQGNSWYANALFILSDGRRASSTNVYTKVNDDTYTFSSENRDIEGRLLPNIGPFTDKRIQ